ncbi:MAG: hypothetical protein K1X57_18325 [Gemmataceae bacterium]|nr:hypothetical protein [Gemmataceae bacterium]
MPVLQLEPNQVAELVRQMSPADQRKTLYALAGGAARREARMAVAEARLIEVARGRGRDWLTMTESEREAFVDEYVHEE